VERIAARLTGSQYDANQRVKPLGGNQYILCTCSQWDSHFLAVRLAQRFDPSCVVALRG